MIPHTESQHSNIRMNRIRRQGSSSGVFFACEPAHQRGEQCPVHAAKRSHAKSLQLIGSDTIPLESASSNRQRLQTICPWKSLRCVMFACNLEDMQDLMFTGYITYSMVPVKLPRTTSSLNRPVAPRISDRCGIFLPRAAPCSTIRRFAYFLPHIYRVEAPRKRSGRPRVLRRQVKKITGQDPERVAGCKNREEAQRSARQCLCRRCLQATKPGPRRKDGDRLKDNSRLRRLCGVRALNGNLALARVHPIGPGDEASKYIKISREAPTSNHPPLHGIVAYRCSSHELMKAP